MSVTESPKSYLQAVMQGLEVPEVPQAAEEPNFQLEEPKVPPEVTVVKSSWDLLLESKSLNEKEKRKKKEKSREAEPDESTSRSRKRFPY